jgi:multiple sugar transport system ATP-binding protein
MKDGVLQQVGSPLDVYERPSNLFVAGFIGSPAMNLLPATVGDGRVRIGDHEIPVDRSIAARAAQAVTVGVRPEAWRVLADGEPGGLGVEATIVEDVGADAYIYGTTVLDGRTEQIAVRSHGRPHPAKGERFRVSIEPKRMHLFDTESGERLAG